jgi:hypothetical protein
MEHPIAPNPKKFRHVCWLFFLALTLFYLSLTPGTIEGQGYNQENLIAANQLATNLVNFTSGRPLVRVQWSRHGFIEPLLHLPLALVNRAVFGDSVKWLGRLAILQPILATSLLCTLLLIWSFRLTANFRWAVLLAACGALGTMLWPYVYIGLETTQSLALFAVAFMVLGRNPTRSWSEALLLGLLCAVAVTVKQNGIFLLPATAYLVFHYFWRTNKFRLKRSDWLKLASVVALTGMTQFANHFAKSNYWTEGDAGLNYFRGLLVDDVWMAALQAFSYFGSANKSLLVYCPVLVLSFLSLGKAYRRQPELVVFALLTLGGMIGGFSIIRMWAEETWGPRYLHVAIAPLLLCLAATKSSVEFIWRKEMLLLTLLAFGFWVSLLGSLFSYTALHLAAIQSRQSTLEHIQHDLRWNHIRFNWQLLKLCVSGDAQAKLWPAPSRWWFARPYDAPSEKTVDLREFATPQSILAQSWRPTMLVSYRVFQMLRILCACCLALSLMACWTLARSLKGFTVHAADAK